jgi:hemolysin activation/secretion protein
MRIGLQKTIRRAVLASAIAVCFAGTVFAQETGLPPISPEGEPLLTAKPAVEVKGFRFVGNTAFLDRHLLDVPVDAERVDDQIVIRSRVKDFVGKTLATEDLEAIRQALTRFYIAAGYINSGAVLPDQDVEDGVVTYQIVEGKLSDVNVQYIQGDNSLKDKGRLNKGYIESRVKHAAKKPLDIIKLRNQLEILRQNPNLKRINAELRPGAEPGDAYLDVQIAETNPWQLGLQVSNHRSPSVGAEQVELLASNRNLTGNSDTLAVRYGVNTGGFDHWEWAGADDFSVDYSLPISPSDTTLVISYTKTDTLVVE